MLYGNFLDNFRDANAVENEIFEYIIVTCQWYSLKILESYKMAEKVKRFSLRVDSNYNLENH